MNTIANPSPAKTIIFMVDDDDGMLNLIAAILDPAGYEVRPFHRAALALKEFPIVKPLLVITDYVMESMNGMDLIRECHRLNSGQKTILVSGTVDGRIFADSPVKPDLFLAKPFYPKELLDCVRKLTDGGIRPEKQMVLSGK